MTGRDLPERACLRTLGAECYTSTAAFAQMKNSEIVLRAMVADPRGKTLLKDEITRPLLDPESVGIELAESLLSKGAGNIIAETKRQVPTH